MKEVLHEASSGNIYQIVHGWFKRNQKDFYFFSWMNESTKGLSFILPKNTKLTKTNSFDIAGMLSWHPSENQSKDILEFIIKEFKQKN